MNRDRKSSLKKEKNKTRTTHSPGLIQSVDGDDENKNQTRQAFTNCMCVCLDGWRKNGGTKGGMDEKTGGGREERGRREGRREGGRDEVNIFSPDVSCVC